jgi:hypothetical protein
MTGIGAGRGIWRRTAALAAAGGALTAALAAGGCASGAGGPSGAHDPSRTLEPSGATGASGAYGSSGAHGPSGAPETAGTAGTAGPSAAPSPTGAGATAGRASVTPGGAPGATVSAGGSCGFARTAANVPVEIRVTGGKVSCAAVLGVERAYAALLRKGGVPGNGGGAPVRVAGWTCAGYPAPQVLRTGDASECHTATAAVIAVLTAPSPRS